MEKKTRQCSHKAYGSKELQEQLINLGMVNLDQHADLLMELDAAQALHVASVLAADDDPKQPGGRGSRNQDTSVSQPWKPKYAAAISALQLVTASSLQRGTKGEEEITIYRERVLECEVHEINYS